MSEQTGVPKHKVRVRVRNWADMVREEELKAPVPEALERQEGYRFSNGRKFRDSKGAYE